MCDLSTAIMGTIGVLGVATSATMGAVQSHQQKKQARKAAEQLEKQKNMKVRTNETEDRADIGADKTKRTIGSLRVPLDKTTNTGDTGINSGASTASTGLNIPM
jgi:ubiquinone biosynthesis protein UbiJ